MGSEFEVGTVVRHRIWQPEHYGTVVRVEDGSVFVQWHGTCVEDQITLADGREHLEVTDLPNPPDNGLRLLTFDSTWTPRRTT